MQRYSSWVTRSMLKRWDKSCILTQCSYMLDTCIRCLVGGEGTKHNGVGGGWEMHGEGEGGDWRQD